MFGNHSYSPSVPHWYDSFVSSSLRTVYSAHAHSARIDCLKTSICASAAFTSYHSAPTHSCLFSLWSSFEKFIRISAGICLCVGFCSEPAICEAPPQSSGLILPAIPLSEELLSDFNFLSPRYQAKPRSPRPLNGRLVTKQLQTYFIFTEQPLETRLIHSLADVQ